MESSETMEHLPAKLEDSMRVRFEERPRGSEPKGKP